MLLHKQLTPVQRRFKFSTSKSLCSLGRLRPNFSFKAMTDANVVRGRLQMKCVRYLKVSQRVAQKVNFSCFWNKSQLQLNEVCYKVSLRENFQRQY